MVEAKRCDVCGEYYLGTITYTLTRIYGNNIGVGIGACPRDVCSRTCLAKWAMGEDK